MSLFQPYIARPIRFAGIIQTSGYRLKQYAIIYGGKPFREADHEAGLHLALDSLPQPAITDSRPGVGFVISHQGNGADYAVLGWWDNENELPMCVFVRPQTAEANWRPARDGESVCVWDLEVIWFERQAYVQTMLNGLWADDYLERHIG